MSFLQHHNSSSVHRYLKKGAAFTFYPHMSHDRTAWFDCSSQDQMQLETRCVIWVLMSVLWSLCRSFDLSWMEFITWLKLCHLCHVPSQSQCHFLILCARTRDWALKCLLYLVLYYSIIKCTSYQVLRYVLLSFMSAFSRLYGHRILIMYSLLWQLPMRLLVTLK